MFLWIESMVRSASKKKAYEGRIENTKIIKYGNIAIIELVGMLGVTCYILLQCTLACWHIRQNLTASSICTVLQE